MTDVNVLPDVLPDDVQTKIMECLDIKSMFFLGLSCKPLHEISLECIEKKSHQDISSTLHKIHNSFIKLDNDIYEKNFMRNFTIEMLRAMDTIQLRDPTEMYHFCFFKSMIYRHVEKCANCTREEIDALHKSYIENNDENDECEAERDTHNILSHTEKIILGSILSHRIEYVFAKNTNEDMILFDFLYIPGYASLVNDNDDIFTIDLNGPYMCVRVYKYPCGTNPDDMVLHKGNPANVELLSDVILHDNDTDDMIDTLAKEIRNILGPCPFDAKLLYTNLSSPLPFQVSSEWMSSIPHLKSAYDSFLEKHYLTDNILLKIFQDNRE